MSADALIEERAKTHGMFADNSRIFSDLIAACSLENFDPKEQYAVAAIYLKLARLASGQMAREHWEDIEGYARLMVRIIDGDNP
jgi:hypothetical protein